MKEIINKLKKIGSALFFYFFTIVFNIVYLCFMEICIHMVIDVFLKVSVSWHLDSQIVHKCIMFFKIYFYTMALDFFIEYNFLILIEYDSFIEIFTYVFCILIGLLLWFLIFNECTWEGFILMLIFLFMIWFLISYYIYKSKKIKKNNFF